MRVYCNIFIITIFLHETNCQSENNLDSFICTNLQIITIDKICDGHQDCSDNSDEVKKLCYNILCPPNKFRCYYGACISQELKCDGINHCADSSDERQCGNCKEDEYNCSSGECIDLNQLCDGITQCKDDSDESEICEKATACPSHTYRCKVGGCIYLQQVCDGNKDCIDNSDEAQCNIKENVFCPPLTSGRINAHCEIDSGPRRGIYPCNEPLPPGAIVHYQCKTYYIPETEEDNFNKEMVCQADGTWNREGLRCVPECGNVESAAAPLIVQGWQSERGKYPWHAVIFNLMAGKWAFICGGTLISEKVIVTAAHCTWDIPIKMINVGLGKYYSDYYRDEPYAQIRNISKIIQQPLYQDIVGNYGSDISLLILEESVEFSPVIKPACIDWNLSDITEHLKENNFGVIVGMGVTEKDTFSPVLRGAYLPVVSYGECIQKQTRDFKKFVTFTSFCAGWSNGTSVCNGDSGGGLVFHSQKNPNKFTLQGIVSVSPRRPGTSFCDPRYYTVFTKVGMYVDWIREVLEDVHQDDIKYNTIM